MKLNIDNISKNFFPKKERESQPVKVIINKAIIKNRVFCLTKFNYWGEDNARTTSRRGFIGEYY